MTLTQVPHRFSKSARPVKPSLRNGNFDQRASNYARLSALRKLKTEYFQRVNSVSIFTP